MKRWPETEAQLAEKVVAWLNEQGWDVYQEVQPFAYGSVADIVAIRGALTWVIETKLVLNMNVIQQAWDWRNHANFISVATPRKKSERLDGMMVRFLKFLNLGRLSIDEFTVIEIVQPNLERNIARNLRNCLSEEHKNYAKAGNADNKYWTPFQGTAKAVYYFVNLNPGCTTKEIVDNVKTHYGSTTTARSCISQYIQRNIIKGIKYEKVGKTLKFYTDEAYLKHNKMGIKSDDKKTI